MLEALWAKKADLESGVGDGMVVSRVGDGMVASACETQQCADPTSLWSHTACNGLIQQDVRGGGTVTE